MRYRVHATRHSPRRTCGCLSPCPACRRSSPSGAQAVALGRGRGGAGAQPAAHEPSGWALLTFVTFCTEAPQAVALDAAVVSVRKSPRPRDVHLRPPRVRLNPDEGFARGGYWRLGNAVGGGGRGCKSGCVTVGGSWRAGQQRLVRCGAVQGLGGEGAEAGVSKRSLGD